MQQHWGDLTNDDLDVIRGRRTERRPAATTLRLPERRSRETDQYLARHAQLTLRTRAYPSELIQADRAPLQQDWMWLAIAPAIAAIVGVVASFHLVPAAAAALAPQVGAVSAHLILAAIYGLAVLVVLSVLRLDVPRTSRARVADGASPCARRTAPD